eukprot:13484-Heterococcus_DN1.PRE.2
MFAHVPRKNKGVNGQTKSSSLRLPCIDSRPDVEGDVLPRSTPSLHRVLKFGASSVGSAQKLGQ